MLNFRINAYKAWKKMEEPHWLNANYNKINYNNYSYYSAPFYNFYNKNSINNENTLLMK